MTRTASLQLLHQAKVCAPALEASRAAAESALGRLHSTTGLGLGYVGGFRSSHAGHVHVCLCLWPPYPRATPHPNQPDTEALEPLQQTWTAIGLSQPHSLDPPA